MKNQDKRPVVYVPRKITYYDDNNQERVAGYYVSKAYLNYAGKWYKEDGTISKEFMIDFVNFEYLEDNEKEIINNALKERGVIRINTGNIIQNQGQYFTVPTSIP